MSRVRTRPTRDETRERLFQAAAQVFEERGIGAASIDAIAAAAGFTRGAFYSNFASKDELIVAMLEDHADRSVQHFRDLLARHHKASDFVTALAKAERSHQDPLGRAPLLHMELILFVARAERRLPELRERLRARRALAVRDRQRDQSGDGDRQEDRSGPGPDRCCWRWKTDFASTG